MRRTHRKSQRGSESYVSGKINVEIYYVNERLRNFLVDLLDVNIIHNIPNFIDSDYELYNIIEIKLGRGKFIFAKSDNITEIRDSQKHCCFLLL